MNEFTGFQGYVRAGLGGNLRSKLLLLVLLLVLPAFALVLHGNFQQRQIEKNRAREGALAICRLAAANQAQFIRNARQLLATLSQFPFLVLGKDRAFCETHFSNLRKLTPDYLNFGLIEKDGKLFCSAAATNTGVDLSDRSYFQRVLQTKRFSVGDFQIGRLTGEPALNFGYPIQDERGGFERVLFASLKLSLLTEAVTNMHLPPGGRVSLIDRSGTILATSPDPEKWVGRQLRDLPFVEWVLSHGEGLVEMPGLDGVPQLHAVTAIKDGLTPSVFVSIGIPLSVSFAAARQVLLRNLIIMGLVGVLVFVASRLYAERFLLQPVQHLVLAANRLASGDLTARTGISGKAREINQLASAFDAMADTIQTRQADVQRVNAEISQMNAQLEQRVTERTTQLATSNQELEAFSYSVSHDLRAPLRHIAGFAQMLEEHASKQLDEKGRRYLNVIGDSADRMGQLIDDLLLFSRMGRQEMIRSQVPMARLVREVMAELEPDLQGRRVQWKIAPLPDVQGDPAMLRQALVNLISNAVKYTTPRAEGIIEIGCDESGERELIFCVRDNGVGFDMQYAGKLFGVFQRLHRDSEFPGTGIGLANVRRIIQRHGGRTWAEGKLDAGAALYFSLPKMARTGWQPA